MISSVYYPLYITARKTCVNYILKVQLALYLIVLVFMFLRKYTISVTKL